MAEKREAPDAQARAPGREDRYATAAGNPFLTSRKAKGHAGGTLYTVTPSAGPAFCIAVNGRTEWALDRLCKAGAKGCTPIDEPGPRWAAYVFNLRTLGVEIETLHEAHEGDFPGTHARYLLRSTVCRGREGGTA